MPVFEPAANEEFSLRIRSQDRRFRALEHPRAPGFAHAMEGGKAFVYRLVELDGPGAEYALKVMKAKHRDPSLEEVCGRLDALKTTPGLGICERCCLSPSTAPETLRQFKNLAYAILMPWVQGLSWFDVLYLGKGGQHTLSRDASLTLAMNCADVLSRLEASGIAHCDLSAGNIVLDPQTLEVELLDVEDIFGPGFQPPVSLPLGTPGYQHKTSAQGQWGTAADRFAGAILLSEMLGWHDEKVRKASFGETFFDPAELQSPGARRLDLLSRAISEHRDSRPLVELLRAAWESDTYDACPPLSDWAQAIKAVKTGVRFTPLPAKGPEPPKNPAPAAWTPLPKGLGNSGPVVTWSDALKPGGGQPGSPVQWADPLAPNQSPPKPVTWGDVSDSEEEENGSAN